MTTRKFTYDTNRGLITSDGEGLENFKIQYYPSNQRHGIGERWYLQLNDLSLIFAQIIYQRADIYSQEDAKRAGLGDPIAFSSDDEPRKISISVLGIPHSVLGARPFDIPAFGGFSSREEQNKIINLFLEAMPVFETPISEPETGRIIQRKTHPTISPSLQKRLDGGEFLA